MAAASALIAERGFWGLSMQDVADRCGLTVPGVLRHFGSKAGLLIEVLAHRDVEDARSLRAQLGVGEEELPDEWSMRRSRRGRSAGAVRGHYAAQR